MTEEFFQKPFQECLIGERKLEDALPPYLNDWQWRGSTSDFIELWMRSDNQPSLDVLQAVEALRCPDDVLCVASNQEFLRARYIANEMGFATLFDRHNHAGPRSSGDRTSLSKSSEKKDDRRENVR
jgi:putative hydrolase of the HAD superfamily